MYTIYKTMHTHYISIRLLIKRVLCLILIAVIAYSCKDSMPAKEQQDEKIKEMEKVLRQAKDAESIEQIMSQYEEKADKKALVLCYRYLGRMHRESSRFSDAIINHQKGLALSLALKDTIEIVRALNNLGTNFRRIGELKEASDYHYRALEYAEAYSEKGTKEGIKNKVVSMNGIGNICITLGYRDDAERFFRLALEDEAKLGSYVGQAINLANLGSIYEQKQRYDSAEIYYKRSLEMNELGKSDMGIGLCYIRLGHLYKIQSKYDEAKREYERAYELMNRITDRWHWLESCIALAEINLLMGREDLFNKYINSAKATAIEIESPEHLSHIHKLYYDYYESRHNYALALEHYKNSQILKDSVGGIRKTSYYADLRLNHEREKNSRELQRIEAINIQEQNKKQISLYVTSSISILSIAIVVMLWYSYRQRIRSNRVLRRVERARTDFFTGITHEFRTPITVIRGLNEQLKDRQAITDEEQKHFTQAIDRQSNRLLSLVNQLLDITRLRSGGDNPQWNKGDIVAYIRMSMENFQLYATQKHISMQLNSSIPSLEIDFIPFYIDKIITNLFSNAIKHTHVNGQINVNIYQAKNDRVVIEVKDNGEGISSEDLPRIFDLFYQSNNKSNDMGTGIGLSFTKLLVEKMHGNIKVESCLGEGSTFTVTLPLRNSQMNNTPLLNVGEQPKNDITNISAVTTVEKVDIPSSDDSRPLILIVEDNADIRLYLKTLLQKEYRLVFGSDGEEGLKMVREHMPDIVLTDVMMPVKDGIELCLEIKSDVLINHIPVVMLTARSSDEDRIIGLRSGVDAYIRKPFQSEELFVVLHNLLEMRSLLQKKYISIIEGNAYAKTEEEPKGDCKTTVKKEKTHSLVSNEADYVNIHFLRTMVELIDKNLDNVDLTPSFVAMNMNISLSQLNRKLNAVTGETTSVHILKRRLSRAQTLLRDTDLTITQVAMTCGFTDTSHLTRAFRKEYGETPTSFRNH
ncbi:MAG: ATP-binding protein [Bacteroides sp.]|nr:ATP-binding protein [Bacteroides sp.]